MKITVEFDSPLEFHEFVVWQERKKREAGKTRICCSGLRDRTKSVLALNGIEFLEDALLLSDAQLMSLEGVGKMILNEFKDFRLFEKPEAT